jgi:NADH:ubiquinone reductase (H+-translocating)
MIRVVLVHPGDFVLPEVGEELGRYAGRKLAERGIEIRLKTKIKAATSNGLGLSDGTHIITRTLVGTVGTSPGSVANSLNRPKAMAFNLELDGRRDRL